MIKTLVFDIGNVLVEWNPIPYIRKVLGPDVDAAWWNRAVFEGVEWKNGDEGIFSRRQTREALMARYPDKAEEIGRLLDGCDGILVESGRNAKLLEKLHRAGFELYFLSNTNPDAFEHMQKTCSFFSQMDGGIASYKVGLMKPSHKIFEMFTDVYAKTPAECVFVDDTPANTAAARECGWNTVTLARIDDLESELLAFGDVRERLWS